MLEAIRLAAPTGMTMSAATSRIPTTRIESATVTAASAAIATLSALIGTARDAGPFLVDRDRRERTVQERDCRQPHPPEHGDDGDVGAGDGQDRAEQVLEQIHVQGSAAETTTTPSAIPV